MAYGFDFYRFLQTLHDQILLQKERLISLEQSIHALSETVKALQDKPSTHVDRIEYHFDQLKVERLDGTLNIGLTPQAGGTIEDYVIGEKSAHDVTIDPLKPDLARKIQQHINHYLNTEADGEIQNLERQFNKEVGAEFRQVLIEDVRRQVEGRVKTYLKHAQGSSEQPGQSDDTENQMVHRIKQDIRTALRQYFDQLPSSGDNSGKED